MFFLTVLRYKSSGYLKKNFLREKGWIKNYLIKHAKRMHWR